MWIEKNELGNNSLISVLNTYPSLCLYNDKHLQYIEMCMSSCCNVGDPL